jgi:hypothetical protein
LNFFLPNPFFFLSAKLGEKIAGEIFFPPPTDLKFNILSSTFFFKLRMATARAKQWEFYRDLAPWAKQQSPQALGMLVFGLMHSTWEPATFPSREAAQGWVCALRAQVLGSAAAPALAELLHEPFCSAISNLATMKVTWVAAVFALLIAHSKPKVVPAGRGAGKSAAPASSGESSDGSLAPRETGRKRRRRASRVGGGARRALFPKCRGAGAALPTRKKRVVPRRDESSDSGGDDGDADYKAHSSEEEDSDSLESVVSSVVEDSDSPESDGTISGTSESDSDEDSCQDVLRLTRNGDLVRMEEARVKKEKERQIGTRRGTRFTYADVLYRDVTKMYTPESLAEFVRREKARSLNQAGEDQPECPICFDTEIYCDHEARFCPNTTCKKCGKPLDAPVRAGNGGVRLHGNVCDVSLIKRHHRVRLRSDGDRSTQYWKDYPTAAKAAARLEMAISGTPAPANAGAGAAGDD